MTAALRQPLGQGAALAAWQKQARSRALPHAMIVEGARGSGKSTVIQWLAASLLCPSDIDADGPCGICRSCKRVAAQQHPDLHVIERARDKQDAEDNEKSFYVIKVDQVRAAQDALLRHAVEGGARVLVIFDADCAEEPAQNALLKTLEEPGIDTFLLLEATRPEKLLPTVRSRAQRLRVLPLADELIGAELSRIVGDGGAVDRALKLANGSLGLAIAGRTEHAVQLQDLVRSMLGDAKGLRPIVTARAVLEGNKDRKSELEAARTFLWILRSELRARLDQLAASGSDAYVAGNAEPWTTWIELALAAEQDLELMIPPEQALAACLLQFEHRRPR